MIHVTNAGVAAMAAALCDFENPPDGTVPEEVHQHVRTAMIEWVYIPVVREALIKGAVTLDADC